MTYSGSGSTSFSSSGPPRVLQGLNNAWHNEQAKFPDQLRRAKDWMSTAERELTAEIAKIECKVQAGGHEYLERNPKVAQQLKDLKQELQQLKRGGESGIEHFLHRDRDSLPAPPNDMRSLAHSGPGRMATVYGESTATRAARNLRKQAATGSAGRW